MKKEVVTLASIWLSWYNATHITKSTVDSSCGMVKDVTFGPAINAVLNKQIDEALPQ